MTQTVKDSDRQQVWAEEARALAASCAQLRARVAQDLGGSSDSLLESAVRLLDRARSSIEHAVNTLQSVPASRSAVEPAGTVPRAPLNAHLVRWADALVAGSLATCVELADAWPARVEHRETARDLLRRGSAALVGEDWSAALPAVRFVIGALTRESDAGLANWGAKDEQRLAMLHVAAARLELHVKSPDLARDELHTARQWSQDRAPYQAALVEYHLQMGEMAHAEESALTVEELAPDHPAGYVAEGLCTAAQGGDPKAQYAAAADAAMGTGDPLAALSQALSPQPAVLLHVLAEKAVDAGDADLALVAIGRALDVWDADEPEEAMWRRVAATYSLKARALGLIGASVDEQASARRAAAERFAWANDLEAARRELGTALSMDADDAEAHYLLADVLLTTSVTPQPPYVDPQFLDEADDAWARAVELDPGQDAWRQRVRAAIVTQRANIAGVGASELQWEGACHLEQALAHGPEDVHSYRALGRLYGQLELFACGLRALDRAGELSEDDSWVIEQRAILFANAARYDDALAVLPEVEDRDWAELVRAAVLVNQGRPQDLDEAIRLLEAEVGSPQPALWVWGSLVDAYLAAGRPDYARSSAQDMVDDRQRYEPLDRDDRVVMASSLMVLGRFEQALQLLEELEGDPTARLQRQRKIAVCRLALGDVAAARDLFDGIESDRAISEWVAVLNDLGLAERLAPDHARDRVVDIVTRARELIEAQRTRPPGERTAEAELQDLVDEPGGATPTSARTAALAGLSRLARETGELGVAVEHALALAAHSPGDLATAVGGLLSRLLRDEGDRLVVDEDDPAGAVTAYELATTLGGDDRAGHRAELHAVRASATVLSGGRPSDGEISGLVHGLGDEPSDAAALLVRATAPMLMLTDHYWQVRDTWAAAAAGSEDPFVHAALAAATDQLAPVLDRVLGGDEAIDAWTSIHPLAIELGSTLVPEDPRDTGPDWLLFQDTIPRMKERLEHQLGIVMPGVRVRPGLDLEPDEYAVLLHEAVTAVGRLGQSELTPDHLATLGPVVQHLEQTILRNTDSVFGVEEFEALLAAVLETSDASRLARLVDELPSTASKLRWGRALRRVLAEGVTIAGWHELLHDERMPIPVAVADVDTLEDHLRRTLRASLPGNGTGVRRFRVPPGWQEVLDRASPSGRRGPAPTEAHVLVRDLGLWHAQQDSEVAVVTRTPASRRLLRALVRGALPDLRVLAEAEVPDATELPFLLAWSAPDSVPGAAPGPGGRA